MIDLSLIISEIQKKRDEFSLLLIEWKRVFSLRSDYWSRFYVSDPTNQII